ncbi:hypothetical protein H072_618 [Dactylellina haptotyla CBS 200.50]|uniref:J domain-containing protein n=1 Tax=Dactylellina haptotyla (strain CBS 200.50) TaxID=1284197 RepID=S8AQZ7_DACHA|nr:hypothetical protein H072_618 [Dactylellina haptotyla CBS 200.50]
MPAEEVVSHYFLLYIEHDATDAQILRGFRRRSRDLHPDRHAVASEEDKKRFTALFQKLVDARDCLLDKNLRDAHNNLCASMRFTHERDPGNFFRRKAEAERREREAAQERTRQEERERYARRKQKREEQQKREAEERQRQETRAREAREREKREQERREREREQQEQEKRERERREQQARRERLEREERARAERELSRLRDQTVRPTERDQNHQHQGTSPRSSQSSNFNHSAQDWQTFFTILQFLSRAQNAGSGNRQPSSFNATQGSCTPNIPSSTSSGTSTPFSDIYTDYTSYSYGGSTTYTTPGSSPPRPQGTARQDTTESEVESEPESEAESAFEFQWARTPNFGNTRARTRTYQPVPSLSSGKRWSAAEFEDLIRLRTKYPSDRWDDIASRLNAKYGMGRNGNAARLKHRTYC